MKFKINPGEFRHSIEIQRPTSNKSKDNIPSLSWKTLFKAKAKVLNIRGNEFLEVQGNGSEICKTFYIRAPKKYEISNEDRVIYKETIYNIVYSNDIENRGIYLELKCELVK